VTTTEYRPISCDLHSQYELLAMRQARVSLDALLPAGAVQGLMCRVLDVRTRNGAEYLELQSAAGERFSCRLDRVRGMRLADGRQISDYS